MSGTEPTTKPATVKGSRAPATRRVTAVVGESTHRPSINKRRKTVTLDADLVDELESRGGSLSAHVNEYVARGIEWDKRQAQIFAVVEDYEAEFGKIPDDVLEHWEAVLS